MSHPKGHRSFWLVGALLVALAAASPAHAGPPWISVELPANPFDRGTRGALLVVHTYHHAVPVRHAVSCSFEGLVAGERRTRSCDIRGLDRAGTFAVRGAVPGDGIWMLVVRVGERGAGATALVQFDDAGAVVGVRVPTRRDGRLTVPTSVSAREIDALLRARADALSGDGRGAVSGSLAGLGLVALPLWVLAVRRRLT